MIEFSVSVLDETEEGDTFETVRRHVGDWATFGSFVATLLDEGHTIIAPSEDDVWDIDLMRIR